MEWKNIIHQSIILYMSNDFIRNRQTFLIYVYSWNRRNRLMVNWGNRYQLKWFSTHSIEINWRKINWLLCKKCGRWYFCTFITIDSISFLTKVDIICWYGVQKSRSHSLSRSKNIKNNFTECPKMMCNIRINQIFQKCFGSFKYHKIWIQYYI